MRLILFGECSDKVYEKINSQYIKAWIPEMDCVCEEGNIYPQIQLDNIGEVDFDYILITGKNLNEKYMKLLELGVKAYKIRTLEDMTCERHQLVSQNIYFNELCFANMCRTKNKRVLMISLDMDESGAPIAFYYLACSLMQIGYCVQVYCQCTGPLISKYLKAGIPVYIEDLVKRENLINWLNCEKYELIVVNTLLQYKLVEILSQAQQKTLWWIHECENYYQSILEVEGMLPTLGKEIYPVFVGDRVKEVFYQYFGSSFPGFDLLYGVAETAAPNRVENIEKGKIVFALIGAIQYRKAQDVFVDAINLLSPEDRERGTYKIIGKCAFENNSLFQYIQYAENNIDELEYIGGLSFDDMQNEYEKIDVIVCPSRIDPMPVVVSEGMMHKKLCILSDRVGNAKYVEDGYNAFVCRAGSAESLAEKMSFIINNRGKLDEIRNQGYLVFKKYFAMDKFNNNVKELIKKICEEER